jgi:hypothetical protein
MRKYLTFILIILPVLFTVSCVGNHLCGCTTPKPMLTTAMKNDSSWTGAGFKSIGGYQPMTISFAGTDKDNLQDTIEVTFVYSDNQSVFTLHSGEVYYHSAGANGAIKSYLLDTLTSGNTLAVTDYEPHWNFVKGTFSLKFLDPGHPDITFSSGNFDILINE